MQRVLAVTAAAAVTGGARCHAPSCLMRRHQSLVAQSAYIERAMCGRSFHRFVHDSRAEREHVSGSAEMSDDGDSGELVVTLESSAESTTTTGNSTAACRLTESCTVIHHLDPYAQAKISNFVQRHTARLSEQRSLYGVSSQRVQGTASSSPQFYARVRLPVPPEFGDRCGEGYAPTAREAEQVAYMHAEHVLDALGISVFQLSSKQRRHADAAVRAGRSAPDVASKGDATPGSSVPRHEMPSPPPLVLTKPAADTTCTLVGPSLVPLLRHTLASPHFFDGRCVARVRSFFQAQRMSFDQYSRLVALEDDGHTPAHSRLSGGHTGASSTSPTVFMAQIRLPISPRFGNRLCCGTGMSRKDALALACMHAELTIDALGLSLFPNDVAKQQLHARECIQVGRWATSDPGLEFRHAVPTPPPLQCLEPVEQHHLRNGTPTSQGARLGDAVLQPSCWEENAPMDTLLHEHSNGMRTLAMYREVDHLDPDATVWLAKYLEDSAGASSSPTTTTHPGFFVSSFGVNGHETFRASLLVPLSPGALASSSAHTTEVVDRILAIGIAGTAEDAETAAAMHARLLLSEPTHHLARAPRNVPLTLEMHDEPPLPRPPRPQAIRCVREHVGRIVVPGLRAEHRTRSAQYEHSPRLAAMVEQATPYLETMQQVEQALREAQTRLPRHQWSLAADGENRIVVSPHFSLESSQNYVHTLSGVREPDGMAVLRLRDYLERHGLDLDSAVHTWTEPSEDVPDAVRWTATVLLPVPVAAVAGQGNISHLTACGEAYSRAEALTMCAVHAELLVDALGIAWYDHPVLQRKHADTARKLGRWATLRCGETNDLAPPPSSIRRACSASLDLPPPVRKEHALSSLWLKLDKERRHPSQKPPPPPSAPGLSAAATLGSRSDDTSRDGDERGTSDDSLCNVSEMRHLHSTEVFRHAIKHTRFLFHSRGSDFFRAIRQYRVQSGSGRGSIHRAIAELPLSPGYGRRYAVGCAGSKRLACLACAMHALAVFGALSIPVYNGQRQSQLALVLAQCGVAAPQPGAGLMPPSTPSPPGIFIDEMAASTVWTVGGEDTDDFLEIPRPPDADDLRATPPSSSCETWTAYTHACKTYIAEYKASDLLTTVTEAHQAPRSGIRVEDQGLGVVERLPVDSSRKADLKRTCAQCVLPPPPLPFHYKSYGQPPNRYYLCEARVLGTPYRARGVGRTGPESLHRCAMHYEYLVVNTRPSSVFVSPQAPSSPASPPPPPPPQRNPSADGDGWYRSLVKKTHMMELYACGCAIEGMGETCLAVTSHERAVSASSVMRVLAVELKADGGDSTSSTTVTGRSSVELAQSADASTIAAAERSLFAAAASRLYNSLIAQRTDFQTFARQLEAITDVDCSRLSRFADAEALMQSSLSAWLARGEDAPRGNVVHGAADVVGDVPVRRTSQACLSSPLVTRLIELAEIQLGQSIVPTPLSCPAGLRDALVNMGLARSTGMNPSSVVNGPPPPLADSSPVLLVTTLGIAVALVAQCLPPLPWLSDSSTDSNMYAGPALPLQLAKVILGGHMLGCPDLGFELVQRVVTAAARVRENDADAVFIDVSNAIATATVAAAATGANEESTKTCAAFMTELQERYADLVVQLSARAPTSPVTAALTGSCVKPDERSQPGGMRVSDVALTQLLAVYAAATQFTETTNVSRPGEKPAADGRSVALFDLVAARSSDTHRSRARVRGVGAPVPTLIAALCGTFHRDTVGAPDNVWPSVSISALLPGLLAMSLQYSSTPCATVVYPILVTPGRRDVVPLLAQVRPRWRLWLETGQSIPSDMMCALGTLVSAECRQIVVRGPQQLLLDGTRRTRGGV